MRGALGVLDRETGEDSIFGTTRVGIVVAVEVLLLMLLPVEFARDDPSTRSKSCKKPSLVPLAAQERFGTQMSTRRRYLFIRIFKCFLNDPI